MKNKKQKQTKQNNKKGKIKTKYPKLDLSSKSLSDEEKNILMKSEEKNNEKLTDAEERFTIDNE